MLGLLKEKSKTMKRRYDKEKIKHEIPLSSRDVTYHRKYSRVVTQGINRKREVNKNLTDNRL